MSEAEPDTDDEPADDDSPDAEPHGESGVEALFDYDDLEQDVFRDVYGHDGAKTVVGAALRQGDVHVLLEGPPGSGKSVFLLALDENVPGTVYRDGDQITAASLRDALKDDPPILLLDEIDALDSEAYDVLSIPMEHQRLVRDSARESYDVEVGTQVIGACNDQESLPPHIANRFRPLEFEAYDHEDYLDLCAHMLPSEVDWVADEDEGRRVAKRVYEITDSADPRNTRDVAQMARSLDDIEKLAVALDDPDADVEAGPLFPGEIKRAQGEVGKVHLRNVLVKDITRRSAADAAADADGDGDGDADASGADDASGGDHSKDPDGDDTSRVEAEVEAAAEDAVEEAAADA